MDTNSRDVAEFFGKPHNNALRDIKALILTGSDLSALFTSAQYIDAKGEMRQEMDMTLDGFTLPAMGFAEK